MKKARVALAAVFLAAAGMVSAHAHYWIKVSEIEGVNGKVVCQWECSIVATNPHYSTTSGYGMCPHKY